MHSASTRITHFHLALVFVLANACSSKDTDAPDRVFEHPAELAPRAAAGNPLAGLEHPAVEAGTIMTGWVEERLEAGSYTYLKVAIASGQTRWLVTMGPGVERGSLIRAKSVGLRRGFYSRRLDREFEELHFVTIESQPLAPKR